MGKGVGLVGIHFNMLPIPEIIQSSQNPIYRAWKIEIYCHDREKRHMTLMLLQLPEMQLSSLNHWHLCLIMTTNKICHLV